MTAHDLVIRGGTIIDGSGGDRTQGDVAIDGGWITSVGGKAGAGRHELDARDLVVAPGWVDVHTHYDGQVTWDPWLTPSCWHGVTTVVMGNCGVGFAPVRPDRHEWLIALMEGVEDIPGTALVEGIKWEWESFPEYLDALDRQPHALDVAAQVPHGALRGYVMGDRGAEHTALPTAEEVAEMGRLAREAIEAGALGFTTSRTVNHRSSDGRHTPSLTAGADELVGIASAVGASGKGVFEVVADFRDIETEFALLRSMVETSGRPMSITTLQTDPHPSGWRRLLELIDAAVADGLPMRGQVAPRPVGILMSLDGRLNPLMGSSTYRSFAEAPRAERVARLRDGAVRERVLAELAESRGWLPGGYARMYPLGDPPDYDPGAENSVEARARAAGVDPVALAYDALLEGDGEGKLYIPFANYAEGDFAAIREMLLHPHTVPGLGDAGAHCTMISDGSFPTYLVAHWGRERPEDERLPLEWLVRRQTHDTARLVGLHDRGLLAPGYKADVNVIDPDSLGVCAPQMVFDLPAGGRRLVQRARGYRATVVSGEVTFVDGEPAGPLPGRLVRGAQPAPSPVV